MVALPWYVVIYNEKQPLTVLHQDIGFILYHHFSELFLHSTCHPAIIVFAYLLCIVCTNRIMTNDLVSLAYLLIHLTLYVALLRVRTS